MVYAYHRQGLVGVPSALPISLPMCIALTLTLADWDLTLQEHSWGDLNGVGATGLMLGLTGLLEIWPGTERKKENMGGGTLSWSIREHHRSCHSDKRGGSRAVADRNVLPLYMLGDWCQRLKTETNSTKELYSFLPLQPQMHNWEGREQASGTSGNKDYYEAHPQQLT